MNIYCKGQKSMSKEGYDRIDKIFKHGKHKKKRRKKKKKQQYDPLAGYRTLGDLYIRRLKCI